MSANVDKIEKAQKIYDYFVKSPDYPFMHNGRRNDDGVDFSIACYVLGLKPWEEAKKIFKSQNVEYNNHRWIQGQQVFARVEPFLDSWGPSDNKGRALDYLCRHISYYDKKGESSEQHS